MHSQQFFSGNTSDCLPSFTTVALLSALTRVVQDAGYLQSPPPPGVTAKPERPSEARRAPSPSVAGITGAVPCHWIWAPAYRGCHDAWRVRGYRFGRLVVLGGVIRRWDRSRGFSPRRILFPEPRGLYAREGRPCDRRRR